MNGVVIKEIFTHYKHVQEGTSYIVTFGDLYSEEKRNVVCRIHLPILPKEDKEFQLLNVSVKYFDVLGISPAESSQNLLTIIRNDKTPTDQKVPLELDMQRNRLETVKAIERAKKIADEGNLEKAKEEIKKTLSIVQNSVSNNEGYTAHLVSELIDAEEGMKDNQEYEKSGKKKMGWGMQAHQQERSCGKGGYDNQMKLRMKEESRKK